MTYLEGSVCDEQTIVSAKKPHGLREFLFFYLMNFINNCVAPAETPQCSFFPSLIAISTLVTYTSKFFLAVVVSPLYDSDQT